MGLYLLNQTIIDSYVHVSLIVIYFKEEGTFTMVTISTAKNMLTLINVFTVKPEHQQQLLDILVEADQTVMKNLPGYISANFHRSLDGTKVTNYTQWESMEALDAMLHNPAAMPHLQLIRQIAEKVEPARYEVVYSYSADAELATAQ